MEDFQQKRVALDKMEENVDQIISLDFYDDEKRIELLSEVFENVKLVLKDYNPMREMSQLCWIQAIHCFGRLMLNYPIHDKIYQYKIYQRRKKLLIAEFKATEFCHKIDSKERAFWIEQLESVWYDIDLEMNYEKPDLW